MIIKIIIIIVIIVILIIITNPICSPPYLHFRHRHVPPRRGREPPEVEPTPGGGGAALGLCEPCRLPAGRRQPQAQNHLWIQ